MPRNWKYPPEAWLKMSPEERAAAQAQNLTPEERAEKREEVWGPARAERNAEREAAGIEALESDLAPRGDRGKRRLPEMISQALGQIAWDSRVFVTLVGRSVPYSAYAAQEPPLSVEMHRRLVGLALLDLYTEQDEDSKAKSLATKFSPLDASQLPTIRQHHLWVEIRDKVREAAAILSGCRTMDEFAERLEPVMAAEHLRVATFSGSPRDRMKAADEVTGRRSAKKGRTQPEQRGIFIGDGILERLGEALSRSDRMKVIEVPKEEP
jgi:hypothetical protein